MVLVSSGYDLKGDDFTFSFVLALVAALGQVLHLAWNLGQPRVQVFYPTFKHQHQLGWFHHACASTGVELQCQNLFVGTPSEEQSLLQVCSDSWEFCLTLMQVAHVLVFFIPRFLLCLQQQQLLWEALAVPWCS